MGWWEDLWKFLFPPKPTSPPIVVPPPPPPPPQGKLSLWSVAINAYSDAGARLQGCVNDSFNLAAYLSPKGFQAHQLLESNATGQAWEDFWTRAVLETEPGDLTVLHYSGHGSNGPSGLPSDPGQCMVDVSMRPFYASRVGKILDQSLRPGAKVLILLDCCHSEQGTRLFGPSGYRKDRSVPWSWLDTSQDPVPTVREAREFNLTALARSPGNGVIEVAACQANDVTYDATIDGQVQGCATRAWIDAATELDQIGNGRYTYAAFYNRVLTHLPSEEFPNTPQLWASTAEKDQVMWVP